MLVTSLYPAGASRRSFWDLVLQLLNRYGQEAKGIRTQPGSEGRASVTEAYPSQAHGHPGTWPDHGEQ